MQFVLNHDKIHEWMVQNDLNTIINLLNGLEQSHNPEISAKQLNN